MTKPLIDGRSYGKGKIELCAANLPGDRSGAIALFADARTGVAEVWKDGRLKKFWMFLGTVLVFVIVTRAQNSQAPPAWAYTAAAADYKPPVDDGTLRRVPGSTAGWTLTQLRDVFYTPDWHPEDHPVMPEVVARGRKPEVYACGFCHRADGPGGPENSSLAGLPEAYIVRQIADFRSGARQSALQQRLPAKLMTAIAKAATDEETAQAAAYFSSLKPRRLITVIETALVPKTYVAAWVLSPMNEKDKEPIGNRVIEMPKDLEQFESRDTHSQFVAYVPTGSIAKGEVLANGGNGKTIPCTKCHGPDLRGLGAVPGIAGRSPSYLVRQIFDMKRGARAGAGSGLMIGVVGKLSEADMVALAAYTASLDP
jgi:cytochrome c553